MAGKVTNQRDTDAHLDAPASPDLTPERLEHFAGTVVDTISAMLDKERLGRLGQYRDH
jgi:hypothetical protein